MVVTGGDYRIRTAEGASPIHVAAQNGHTNVQGRFLKELLLLILLLCLLLLFIAFIVFVEKGKAMMSLFICTLQ